MTEKLAEIERTATDAIMRGPLPRFYYEHVKRLMLLRQIYRTEWNINITLSSAQDGRHEMLYDQSFVIRNLSGLVEIYDLCIYESSDGDESNKARIRFVEARFEHSSKAEIEEHSSESDSLGNWDEDGSLEFSRSIPLPQGSSLRVLSGTSGFVRENDMFFVPAVDPADGIRVVIDHPKTVNLVVEFPEGPTRESPYGAVCRVEALTHTVARTTWDYPHPIVPSAAIICYWWPSSGRSRQRATNEASVSSGENDPSATTPSATA